MLSVLRGRNFALLWTSGLMSVTGDHGSGTEISCRKALPHPGQVQVPHVSLVLLVAPPEQGAPVMTEV